MESNPSFSLLTFGLRGTKILNYHYKQKKESSKELIAKHMQHRPSTCLSHCLQLTAVII
jgi:transposase